MSGMGSAQVVEAVDVGGLPVRVIDELVRRKETLAVAESLTGGLLGATLVDAPGASQAFRGGLIVYATDLKAQLADVPNDLLEARGAVDPDVAAALAEGARRRCGTDWGVATTGVAGPEPQDGVAVGTVYIAVSGPRTEVRRLEIDGERAAVRTRTVTAALRLVLQMLDATG